MQKNSQILEQKPALSPLKIWIMAARPKTLFIAGVPICVGTVLAIGKTDQIHLGLAFLVLICAVSIQMGVNMINDALDFKKGADRTGRLGPARVTQMGLMSGEQVLKAGFLCFAFSLLCGIPLTMIGGWPFLAALLSSVIFGYLYTGGPFPLAYVGLGEVFAFSFFGYVTTCSAYFFQTGVIDGFCLWAATQMACLATVPIIFNNTRDMISDQKANKKTLSVRFGLNFSRGEITLFSIAPYLIGYVWILYGYPMMAWLPLLSFPLTFFNVQFVWQNEPSIKYNEPFTRSAKMPLIFGSLLVIGYLLS